MTTGVRFPLCVADDSTFWAWHSWPDFASWPKKDRTVVVVPLAGMADWGLGHALDAEETVLMHVLREAGARRPRGSRLLVTPPIRYAFGPDPGCAFGVDPPAVHALLAEIVGSIAASGFRRVVLLNSSPWNEEICAAASRDLRLRHDIQVFRIHLSGLGLDFHPSRSPDRRRLQTLITALTGRLPERAAGSGARPDRWGAESAAPLGGRPLPVAAAAAEGGAILSEAAALLGSLLAEIQAKAARPVPRTPLSHRGAGKSPRGGRARP